MKIMTKVTIIYSRKLQLFPRLFTKASRKGEIITKITSILKIYGKCYNYLQKVGNIYNITKFALTLPSLWLPYLGMIPPNPFQ